MDLAGAVLAVGGVTAAFLTWRATQALTRIEKHRWHTDLTPKVDAKVEHERLVLTFTGPSGLSHLDEVIARISDEGGVDRLGQLHAGGPTAEDMKAHVWAPWCFHPAAKDQTLDDKGRSAHAHLIHELGSWHPLLLTPSAPPDWSASTPDDRPTVAKRWAEEYADKPLRLLITCRREGYEPWHVLAIVPPPPDGWPSQSWP